MTYPEPAVAGTINSSYVALQINTKEADAKSVVERYRQVWTPDVRILDADEFEYYRWNGYLPPFEFLPQTSRRVFPLARSRKPTGIK